MAKPFRVHIELPREVRRYLHRSQIFLSLSISNPYLLRLAIVPAQEQHLVIPTGELKGIPKVLWLPTEADGELPELPDDGDDEEEEEFLVKVPALPQNRLSMRLVRSKMANS